MNTTTGQPYDPRVNLRAMVRGAYDLQKLRMQTGLRLCANFRSKLGQAPGDKEEELDDDALKILEQLRTSFNRLTDGIAKNRTLPSRAGFVGDELITDYTELALVSQYVQQKRVEGQQFRLLEPILGDFEIYRAFLSGIRGVGPAMGGVIISEIDIHKARYVSSLWMYAGLDVGPDGRGRSRRAEHLVDREYTNAKGEQATRKSITYNPFLKTKLMGVLGGSFLKAAGKLDERGLTASPYANAYRQYKHRLESDPAKVDWTKGHRHAAATRYAVKIFLRDLYVAWRPIEGLAVEPSYAEKKLGIVHGGDRKAA